MRSYPRMLCCSLRSAFCCGLSYAGSLTWGHGASINSEGERAHACVCVCVSRIVWFCALTWTVPWPLRQNEVWKKTKTQMIEWSAKTAVVPCRVAPWSVFHFVFQRRIWTQIGTRDRFNVWFLTYCSCHTHARACKYQQYTHSNTQVCLSSSNRITP